MPFDIKIPDPVLKRMPIYYRYLSKLLQLGISRVSSRDLANVMQIKPSQVRQDFFTFGGNGLQGYGYDVKFLHDEIHHIFGLDNRQNIIIIGAGSLGQALAKHSQFEKVGFKVKGIFDTNPQLLGKNLHGMEIRHSDSIKEFLNDNSIDIAVITVPESYAYEIASLVISLGIKGIWNFAPVELNVPSDVYVENINLSDSLMVLSYRMSENKRQRNPENDK